MCAVRGPTLKGKTIRIWTHTIGWVDLFTVGIWQRIHNAPTGMRRLWFAISSTALGSIFGPAANRVARTGIHLAFTGPQSIS